MNIGIIGQGFVGNAVFQKFKNFYNVYTYDLIKAKSNSDFENISTHCKVVFICLPTPMNADGSCDISIVKGVLKKLNKHGKKTIILKSTVPLNPIPDISIVLTV